MGGKTAALDDRVIERLRPEISRWMKRPAKETLYMKVPDAWQLTDRGEPLFPVDATLFFRWGQANRWREELAGQRAERLISVHGESLERFGYTN